MKKRLICLNCPLGCEMLVHYSDEGIIEVQGNRCEKGLSYAEKEIFNPERIVTTTVRIDNSVVPLVPVRTDAGIKRELVFKVIEGASKLRVRAPVRSGQILWEDIFDTGVNLIVTKTLEAVE